LARMLAIVAAAVLLAAAVTAVEAGGVPPWRPAESPASSPGNRAEWERRDDNGSRTLGWPHWARISGGGAGGLEPRRALSVRKRQCCNTGGYQLYGCAPCPAQCAFCQCGCCGYACCNCGTFGYQHFGVIDFNNNCGACSTGFCCTSVFCSSGGYGGGAIAVPIGYPFG
jgi:hypothetical protein